MHKWSVQESQVTDGVEAIGSLWELELLTAVQRNSFSFINFINWFSQMAVSKLINQLGAEKVEILFSSVLGLNSEIGYWFECLKEAVSIWLEADYLKFKYRAWVVKMMAAYFFGSIIEIDHFSCMQSW